MSGFWAGKIKSLEVSGPKEKLPCRVQGESGEEVLHIDCFSGACYLLRDIDGLGGIFDERMVVGDAVFGYIRSDGLSMNTFSV